MATAQVESCEQINRFCTLRGLSDIKYIQPLDLLIVRQDNEWYKVDIGTLDYVETNGNIVELIKDGNILKVIYENNTYELTINGNHISADYFGVHKKLHKINNHKKIIINYQGNFQFTPTSAAYHCFDDNNIMHFYNSDCEYILCAALEDIYTLVLVFDVWRNDNYGITKSSYIENFDSLFNGIIKLKGSDNMYYLVYSLNINFRSYTTNPFLICIEANEIIKVEKVKNILSEFTRCDNTYFMGNISIIFPSDLDEIYRHGFDYIGMVDGYVRKYYLLAPINVGPNTHTKPAIH